MTLYAVGDLQGCLEPLQRLLTHVGFNPTIDTIWFTGDLVNRGPDSIGCLEFVHNLKSSAQIVLGNHDLHLLATWELGLDTKEMDVKNTLKHPKADELLHWLVKQPLLVRDRDRTLMMTHAGIPPIWNDKQARQLAKEVEKTLANNAKRHAFFEVMYGNKPNIWQDSLKGDERLRYVVNAYTRMRFCTKNAKLNFSEKSSPKNAPKDMKPWYAWPVKRKHKIVFGHWASLMGQTNNENYIGLDTGYVWGNYLTLMDMDQGIRYCCDTKGNIMTTKQ